MYVYILCTCTPQYIYSFIHTLHMYIIYIYIYIHTFMQAYIYSCIQISYIHSFIDTYIHSQHNIDTFTFFNFEFCRLILPPNAASSTLLVLPPLFSSLLLPLFFSFLLPLLSLQLPLFSSYCHCHLCSPCCVALPRLVVPPLVASILCSCCHNYCS